MNGSSSVYSDNGCGVPAGSIADLGLGLDGKPRPLKTQRQKAAHRTRAPPTCWPLLDDAAGTRAHPHEA